VELVGILRVLAAHWRAVVVGAVLAAFVALNLAYNLSLSSPHLVSKQTVGGTATTRVLISASDAPSVNLRSNVAYTLPTRAALLADLMATDDVRAQIARKVGVEPVHVGIITPSSMEFPAVPVPLAVSARDTGQKASESEPYLLTVEANTEQPILTIRAVGPDPAAAAKLVDASIDGLETLISTRAEKHLLEVAPLGGVASHVAYGGTGKMVAVAGAMMTFVLWCFGVVVMTGVMRVRRRRRTQRMALRPATAPAVSAPPRP
jgi:hypothetical protein